MIPESELEWNTYLNGMKWTRIEVRHIPTGQTTTVYRDEMRFPRGRSHAENEALIKLEAKVLAWRERHGT